MAQLAGNRPRALVLSCHVLAHYPPYSRSCRLRDDGGRADEPIRPERLPLVTASNRLLKSRVAVHEPDESAAARVRRAAGDAGLVPRIAAKPADRLAHPWRHYGDRRSGLRRDQVNMAPAAKRNVKKAQKAAADHKTIAHLPADTKS